MQIVGNDKLKRRNILRFTEELSIFQVLSPTPGLFRINWALSISPLFGKYTHDNFFFSFAQIGILVKGPVTFVRFLSCTQHLQKESI